MHYARLNHSPVARSAPLVGAARGSAQRPKPCTVVEYYTVLDLDLATRTGVLVAAICVASTPEIITGMRISRVSYVSFPNEAFGP